jgi:hypothetical protein
MAQAMILFSFYSRLPATRRMAAVFRELSACFLCICLLMMAAGGAAAQSAYEVSGIHVDVTAENAIAAREKALAEGARMAVQQLLARQSGGQKRVPKLSQRQIDDMIADFSISGEKTSGVRYIATLSYRFRPSHVNRMLRSAGIATLPADGKQDALVPAVPVRPAAPPVMVFVAFEPPAEPSAGGEQPLNGEAWRAAWRSFTGRNPRTYVMGGSDGAAAASSREQSLAAAQQRGSNEVLTAAASVVAPVEGQATEMVVRYRRFSKQRDAGGEVRFTREDGETDAAFLGRAATGTAIAAASAWKQATVAAAPQRAQVVVTVPADSIETWVDVERRMRRTVGIKRVELIMMARRQVVADVGYTGSLEELSDALEDAGLALSEDDGRWLVTPAAAAPENVRAVNP